MIGTRWKQPRTAAWISALGVAVLLVCANGAWAADTQEEEGIDPFQTVLKAFGFKAKESIDYRERSPLVVPPNRNLPPPENTALEKSNPAWPTDPKKPSETVAKRPVAPGNAQWAKDFDSSSMKTAEPSDVGKIFRNGFSGAFNSFGTGQTEEVGTFRAEPPRTSLTAPPPGYQTPSRAAPYGVTKPNEFDKSHQLEEPKEDKI
jgi:hypothetical protein